METTVLEFFTALEVGYEPKDYSYAREEIPLGNYHAKLDFMLWSKSGLTINCFFSLQDSGKKITLSVYKKSSRQGRYMAGDTEVRFLPFCTELKLTVEQNEIGKPILTDAVVRSTNQDRK